MSVLNINTRIYRMIKEGAMQENRKIGTQAAYWLLLGKLVHESIYAEDVMQIKRIAKNKAEELLVTE